jgi:hypothetical protein
MKKTAQHIISNYDICQCGHRRHEHNNDARCFGSGCLCRQFVPKQEVKFTEEEDGSKKEE